MLFTFSIVWTRFEIDNLSWGLILTPLNFAMYVIVLSNYSDLFWSYNHLGDSGMNIMMLSKEIV